MRPTVARTVTDPASADGIGADAMFTEVYQRLKAMASRQLASHERHTLDTTALVHELYLRVSANPSLAFEQPAQFFAYAARAMRHLLCDRARDRLRQCAGGGWPSITLDGDDLRLAIDSAEEALALDAALVRLASVDARAARTVELRYFAGLSLEQVAATWGWRAARSTATGDSRVRSCMTSSADQIGCNPAIHTPWA